MFLSCCVAPNAWGEELEPEVDSRFFVKLQTGYQSFALNRSSYMSGSWDADLGIGVMFTHLVFEVNLGLSLSLVDYPRSLIINVTSYMWQKAEALGYYKQPFSRGRAVLIGGGVGYRHINQFANQSYVEGNVIKIVSETERDLDESTISALVRAGMMLNSKTLLMLDYDISPLKESKDPIQTLGVNLGYVF